MARKEHHEDTKSRGAAFAKRLKATREREGMTQSDLSQKSNVPLDTLRSIENGRVRVPGLFIAADLVHALDSTLDEWLQKKK